METPEICFTAMLDKYDSVIVHPVFEDEDNVCHIVEPSEANLWTVYLRNKDGRIETVADWPNKAAAQHFALGLELAMRASELPMVTTQLR